jgi:hypothetical protein
MTYPGLPGTLVPARLTARRKCNELSPSQTSLKYIVSQIRSRSAEGAGGDTTHSEQRHGMPGFSRHPLLATVFRRWSRTANLISVSRLQAGFSTKRIHP